MAYTPYISVEEYKGNIPSLEVEKRLTQASRHIDTLTFNRIVGKFDDLTEFQQEIVKEVCLNLANWEYENDEMINSVFDSYSINGVSMKFGGGNIKNVSGVYIPTELYQTLCQTGLCCRVLGRRYV